MTVVDGHSHGYNILTASQMASEQTMSSSWCLYLLISVSVLDAAYEVANLESLVGPKKITQACGPLSKATPQYFLLHALVLAVAC